MKAAEMHNHQATRLAILRRVAFALVIPGLIASPG